MRSHRGDLRLSNPDWNEYELLGGIRWLRAMPGNPLGQETAGRDRITITATKGDPAPIPPELLGAWWRAAERAPSRVASDYYRFQLLTGCRGVEIHGHKLHQTRRSGSGTSTNERAGCCCGTRDCPTNETGHSRSSKALTSSTS